MDDADNTRTARQDAGTGHPWDKLPTETDQEFITFQAYLVMPAPRSARGLAQATGLASRSLDRTRTRNRWNERAAAWDAHRIQETMLTAPADLDNPYKRMLMQAAGRAQNLHDTATKLLNMAARRLDWAEKQYQRDLKRSSTPEDIAPPVPGADLVAAIRGASEVLEKSAEAQAMVLGVTDVMKLQAAGGNQ